MIEPEAIDAAMEMEDDYDEEADSDFKEEDASDNLTSSSEYESQRGRVKDDTRSKKRRKTKATAGRGNLIELESGDDATIRECQKAERKEKRKDSALEHEDCGAEDLSWRAKTRAMRERDNEEKKRKNLASTKVATLDIDKVWEEMNRPVTQDRDGALAASKPDMPGDNDFHGTNTEGVLKGSVSKATRATSLPPGRRPNDNGREDNITIKRTYKFAGEVITEDKTVPRSSAEAQLWLSQQSTREAPLASPNMQSVRRPLRKISRFDPNLNNLDAFRKIWEKANQATEGAKGSKLNTVEKSKMDWDVHVDQEGLKEELDEHAKAKGGYLSRMDFLGQVEQRREEEARAARLRG